MTSQLQSTYSADDVVALIQDILERRGGESYLGESVSMTEHMLQSASIAEQAGETPGVVVAALLHDIGHYTGEFGEDYLDRGVDNLHEMAGAKILQRWFPPEVTEPVRWHVAAKRYLCAVEPSYLAGLSEASRRSLELQGGPMSREEAAEFAVNPWLDTIVRVRRYDDGGKVAGRETPGLAHYLGLVRRVIRDWNSAAQ